MLIYFLVAIIVIAFVTLIVMVFWILNGIPDDIHIDLDRPLNIDWNKKI